MCFWLSTQLRTSVGPSSQAVVAASDATASRVRGTARDLRTGAGVLTHLPRGLAQKQEQFARNPNSRREPFGWAGYARRSASAPRRYNAASAANLRPREIP